MTTLTRWAWENARILSDNACLNSFMLFFVSTHLFVCIFLRLERFIYFELLYMRIYILDVIQFHIFSSLVIYLDIWKSEHQRYKKDVFRNIQSCICQYVTVHFLPCVHMCVWNPKSAPVLPHCPLWCTNIHLASTKTQEWKSGKLYRFFIRRPWPSSSTMDGGAFFRPGKYREGNKSNFRAIKYLYHHFISL